MNTSPLLLQSLNRLIGITLRQVQLHKGCSPAVLYNLKWAVRWLNLARKSLKRGVTTYFYIHLNSAMREIKWARVAKTVAA
jgi:hypothetical protein